MTQDFADKSWLHRRGNIRHKIIFACVVVALCSGAAIAARGAEPNIENAPCEETLELLNSFEAKTAPNMDPATARQALEALTLKIGIENVAAEHGSPDPCRFAQAVMKTKYPRLITGIGVAEKGAFNPSGNRGRRGEKGFSQIYESAWGTVGNSIEAQVRKTESILKQLLSESNGSEEVALRKYNAGKNWRCEDAAEYARTALSVAREL